MLCYSLTKKAQEEHILGLGNVCILSTSRIMIRGKPFLWLSAPQATRKMIRHDTFK